MDFKCEIKEQPGQPTLAMRTRSAARDLLALYVRCFGSMRAYLDELGETPAGRLYAAFYNLDTRDLDVEMGIPVVKTFPAKGEIRPGEIPAGRYASTLFTGSYDQAEPAYDALINYIQENGAEFADLAYEFYHEDPFVLSDRSRTTIAFLIK